MSNYNRSREQARARVTKALKNLRDVVAEARGRFGRDLIRGLPQGRLMDALDSNRESSFPTDMMEVRKRGH
jgi:hypothetical protein